MLTKKTDRDRLWALAGKLKQKNTHRLTGRTEIDGETLIWQRGECWLVGIYTGQMTKQEQLCKEEADQYESGMTYFAEASGLKDMVP